MRSMMHMFPRCLMVNSRLYEGVRSTVTVCGVVEICVDVVIFGDLFVVESVWASLIMDTHTHRIR